MSIDWRCRNRLGKAITSGIRYALLFKLALMPVQFLDKSSFDISNKVPYSHIIRAVLLVVKTRKTEFQCKPASKIIGQRLSTLR